MSEKDLAHFHNPNICIACFDLPNDLADSVPFRKIYEFLPNQNSRGPAYSLIFCFNSVRKA